MTEAALATTGRVRLFADRLHRSKVIRRLVHHRLFMTGLVLFALIVAMAASAGVLAPTLRIRTTSGTGSAPQPGCSSSAPMASGATF